jgi:hypothetical protein
MVNRISPIHLKQFIGKLVEDESNKTEIFDLLDRYIDTVKSDKNDLVDGIQQLLNSPEDGNKNAKDLIDRFGKMPRIIFSKD